MATSKNRWELEEKRKKQQLLQNALDKANVGATAEKLSNAAQSIKKNTTTKSSSTASTPTVTAPKTNTSAITPAKSTAAKTSVFQELPKLAGTVQKTAQTVLQGTQKNNDLRQLQKNSIAWHGTTDAATRSSLQRQNDMIRQKLGLSFDPTTGATFDAKTGTNYSTPTQLLFGSSAGQRANTAAQFAANTMPTMARQLAQRNPAEDKNLSERVLETIEASTKRVRAGLDNWFATGNVAADEEAEQKYLAGEELGWLDQLRMKDRWGENWESYLSGVRDAYRTGDTAIIEDYEKRAKEINSLYDTTPLFDEAAQQAEGAKTGLGTVGRTALDALGMGADMLGAASIASTGGGGAGLFTGVSSVSAAGQAADQARRMGASAAQQEDYGNAVGALNFAVERLGGIGGGEAASKIASRILPEAVQNAAGKATSTAVGRVLAGGAEEGLEGAIQSEGERALRNAILGANEAFDPAAFGANIGYNALMGSVFRGGQEVSGAVRNRMLSTSVNTDPAVHTPEQMAKINEYVHAVDDGLLNFIQKRRSGELWKKAKYIVAQVDARMKNDIKNTIGVDTDGYTIVFDVGSDEHIERRHGANGAANHSMQDIEDIARLPYVVQNYDELIDLHDTTAKVSNSDNTPAKIVQLLKRIDGTYYVVEAVPDSARKEINVISAYLEKAKQQPTPGQRSTTNGLAPLSSRGAVDNSISQSEANINQQETNSQALGRRMAELDAQKRLAETLLPGPIRDRAIQQAENEMRQVQQQTQTTQSATTAQTPPQAEVQIPADAVFQYGLSPEAAALEARERARNEAAQAAREQSVGAAEYNFDPFSRMSNEYGAIKRGEAPREREVDVPVSTDGNDRVSLFARTAMEAKATPDEAIERFEQEVANGIFSHDVRKDKESVNKARQTITEKGFDGAMEQWEDVTSGRRSAGKDDIVLAEILYARAMKDGDIDTGMRLAAEIAAEGTRAGQSIQAMRLLKRTTPEGKLYYIKKTVDNVQKDLNQKYGDKAPQVQVDEQLALDLLNAKTDQDANAAMDAIYNDVAASIPATFGDRLNAWRYFAMLGNPRTHIRNVIGNIVYQIPTRVSNKLSAGLQKAFIKDKDRRTRSILRNGKIKEFAKQDYQVMQDVMDGNQYTSEMSEIQRRKKPFPKPIQAVMDANSKALDFEDQIFKRMTYVNSMTEFLTARRVDVDHISQDMLEQARTHAIKDAKRATFQDASALADAIGKIEKKNKATEIIVGGLVPFKRTPINIAKRGFDLSPAGLLKSLTYNLVQVKKGNMTATDAIDHISTGLTGTSLAALGAFLAAQGLLSASSPENDKERNFDVAQGSQEYAINIGPYSYTIDWAAPAALPMFVGAEFYNAIAERDGGEEQAFKQATDAISRLFEPMINMTMLSGISSTLQSVGYSQTNPIFSIAENIGENYAGQVVPTLLGQIARTIDGTRRTTFADGNSQIPDGIQTFLQRQANKIPGLSKRQPAYTDVWGREDHSDNVVMRAFENFLSPGYISERVTGDAEQALRDLYNATGEASILPSKPQKYYKKDGKNVYLNAEQYATLTKEKGQQALDAIGALVQSSAYQSMTNDERVNAIKDIYDYSSALAANKVYGKELEGTVKTVQESGIAPGLYYAYKELQDTLNDTYESYEARDEVFQTIRSDDSLTDYQKNQLYHTLLIKGTSESQWEKYVDISGTVTAEEYIDAMIQSQAIKAYGDELDEDRATTEATEFSRYLDMKQYDSEKRAALENTFKFYNMFPAEAQNYTFEMISTNGSEDEKANAVAIQNSGVTAAQYLTIKTMAGEAEYESGVTGAKLAAQAAIVAQNTQNYDQYAAIMHALGYKKIEDVYTGAGTLPAVEDSGSQISRQVESSTGFINPTTATRSKIVSWYGNREAPDTTYGKGSSFHEGVDIGGPNGQNLDGEIANSIGDGTVVDVGFDQYGYGNYVVVDYGNGYQALYGHLRQPSVSTGQKVNAGEEIGIIGGTGNVEAPHLHLKMTKDGQNIDPLTVIPGYGTARPATTSSTTKSSGGSGSRGGGKSSGSSKSAKSTTIKGFDSYEGLDGLWM